MVNKKSIKAACDWAQLDKACSDMMWSLFEGTNAWLEYMESYVVKALGEEIDPKKVNQEVLANLFLTWLDGMAEYKDFYNNNAKHINDIKKQLSSLEKTFNNEAVPTNDPTH